MPQCNHLALIEHNRHYDHAIIGAQRQILPPCWQFCPPDESVMTMDPTLSPFMQLVQLMQRLRSKEGCPWDCEQTWQTLIPYTIEEAFEVVEAIESQHPEAVKEELGDLLFHVVFYAQIAAENQSFTIDDVATGIVQKMIARHPHVFGEHKLSSANEVIHQWEEIKKQEKKGKTSLLDGISGRLPALLWAYKMQQKLAKVGFDWDKTADVLVKVKEEMDELAQATDEKNKDAIEEEMGDLLFTMVNLARHLHVNPESALRRSTIKFKKRFTFIENHLQNAGQTVEQTSLQELDRLWQASKKEERSTKG